MGTIQQSISCAKTGSGVVALIGVLSGIHHEQMPNIIMQAVMQACVLRGIYVGPKTMLEDLVEVVSAHNRPMPVSDTFEFTQEGVLAAFRHLKDGKHIGKICIDVDRKSNDV